MNLIKYLKNGKIIPKVYLYIVELKNGNDHFIKIGVSGFIHIQYSSFKGFGYDINEIEKIQFPCEKDAKIELEYLKNLYLNYQYLPLHKFPQPECCFSIDILEGLNLAEETHDDNNENIMRIERNDKIQEMSENGIEISEIAKEFNMSKSQVYRIIKPK